MNGEHWVGYAFPDALGGRESIGPGFVLSESHDRPVRRKLCGAESVFIQIGRNLAGLVIRECVRLQILAVSLEPSVLKIGLLLVTLYDDDGISISGKTLFHFHLKLVALQDTPVKQ